MKEGALLLALIFLSTSKAKTICYIEDEKFSSCVKDKAQTYFSSLVKELKPYWKLTNVTVENDPIKVHVLYDLAKFMNSSKGATVTLNYDTPTKTLFGTIMAPHVGFESSLKINAEFGDVPFRVEGVGEGHSYDMDASFRTRIHLKGGNGNNLDMGDLDFKVNNYKNPKLLFRDFKSSNIALEVAFNQFSSFVPNIFFTMFREEWTELLKLHYRYVTEVFLKKLLDEKVIYSK